MVGHVPRAISMSVLATLWKDTQLSDLPQGGIEIPCKLIFKGRYKIREVRWFLKGMGRLIK